MMVAALKSMKLVQGRFFCWIYEVNIIVCYFSFVFQSDAFHGNKRNSLINLWCLRFVFNFCLENDVEYLIEKDVIPCSPQNYAKIKFGTRGSSKSFFTKMTKAHAKPEPKKGKKTQKQHVSKEPAWWLALDAKYRDQLIDVANPNTCAPLRAKLCAIL